jgi:hypothetical protein
LVERRIVVPVAEGSNPSTHPNTARIMSLDVKAKPRYVTSKRTGETGIVYQTKSGNVFVRMADGTTSSGHWKYYRPATPSEIEAFQTASQVYLLLSKPAGQ